MPDSSSGPPSERRPGDSIIESIAARTGRSPRISLRDAGTGDGGPLIDPKAHALQDELSKGDQGKYRILGEIARGGMGVVLRGHDLELGREVALKVVDADLAGRPEVVERFVEEAQIGGQLQHPGIVPVYELGLMADDRPYFTMKLIKGRTLAAMLSRRKSPDEDRARFLSIFESVCQTMAYAHSKGVIHRDLKPANIMVGAFGEVQVVDWGLSKVLRSGGVADELAARDTALSVIETVRSGPGSSSDSIVGNVLGTPAYMSPEQAQGEIAKLDERTDVFALGAILCEILTGKGPYVSEDSGKLVQMAALAELDDAKQRIDASGASAELTRLCHLCLMPSRAARPRDAEEVARVVHEHLSGLEQRAHQEHLNAERSRRQTQLAVFGGLFLVLAIGGGGGGYWWLDRQQREREGEVARAFEEVTQEVVEYERAGDYEQAVESARASLRLVESSSAGPALRERADSLVRTSEARRATERERLTAAARELEILDFLVERPIAHILPGSTATLEDLNTDYRAALREFGIDLDASNLADVLAEYRDTDLGIELARGFDSWARAIRADADREGRELGGLADEGMMELELITGIGLDIDPDPARATIRKALVEGDPEPVLELGRSDTLADESPATLELMASTLYWLGEEAESLRVATLATDTYPTDFRLHVLAGNLFYAVDASGNHTAVSHLETAIAMRPEFGGLYFRLAEARLAVGDAAGSLQASRVAHRLLPNYDFLYRRVGISCLKTGQFEDGIAYLERALPSYEPGSIERADQMDMVNLGKTLAGVMDREEYVAWVGAQNMSPAKWFRVSLTFSALSPEGTSPLPERCLELLEASIDAWPADVDFLITAGSSYALLGDPRGIKAGQDLEALAEDDRFYKSIALLITAATQANLGHTDDARRSLMRAEFQRDQLYSGRREQWAGGAVDVAFKHLGPIARGR